MSFWFLFAICMCMWKTGSSIRWFLWKCLFVLLRMQCSRFDNSVPFFLFLFCGKGVVRFISLVSPHKKYIYFCISKSSYFPRHWHRTLRRREYTKTLYKKKKREREEYTWSEFFSSFSFFQTKEQKKRGKHDDNNENLFCAFFFISLGIE